MNCTLDPKPTETRFVTPATSIRKTEDGGYIVEAEMPGVPKDGIEVSVHENELILIGRRNSRTESGKAIYREIPRADFRRVFELDGTIDRNKIAARIENGVLSVVLPLAEEVKPRRIVVEG